MDSPLFSIIIPHYDIPDLLMRCLKSIPISEDIQVIVVDDNSLDADTYLEKYPELSRPYLEFIRTTKGGGAGYARNVGLDHAKGKWLLFADADDFFADNMYDSILSETDSTADVIYYRKTAVLSEDTSISSRRGRYLDEIEDVYLFSGDDLPVRTKHYPPWGKLIRRDLVKNYNIRFDELKYSNDCIFSILVGYYSHTIDVKDKVLYYCTERKDSLTAGFCTKPNELSIRTDVAFRVDKFLYSHGVCNGRAFKQFFWRCFRSDRLLLKNYFCRLEEIYPTRRFALQDLRKGHSVAAQLAMYLYAFFCLQSNEWYRCTPYINKP